MSEERADQTFLLADLAGYTAMTEAHGDEYAADATADFCAGVRALLPEYEAEEIKTIGDAILVRLGDAAAAVRLAVRLIAEVGTRHGALAVRVGINTGPAVNRGGDWFGACVNLTARVATAGEPGEVLMTDATWRAARGRIGDVEAEARGPRSFKNVAQPVELHAVVLAKQHGFEALPVDPVCHMAVDPARGEEVRVRDGSEYHFCSTECAAVFDRHPERYAATPR